MADKDQQPSHPNATPAAHVTAHTFAQHSMRGGLERHAVTEMDGVYCEMLPPPPPGNADGSAVAQDEDKDTGSEAHAASMMRFFVNGKDRGVAFKELQAGIYELRSPNYLLIITDN